MSEAQTWVTTAYRDIAQTAPSAPQVTVLSGFEAGQEQYWSQDADPHHIAAKTVVLKALEILDDAMQQDERYRILSPHPTFAIGYIGGYIHAYLQATEERADRSSIVPPEQHLWELPERTWLTTVYREIALATQQDEERIEEASGEGQDVFYTAKFDGSYPKTERALAVEMLTMFDEAMRSDPRLPASPNWAVGFLSGYVQAYVEAHHSNTQPLPQIAEGETSC